MSIVTVKEMVVVTAIAAVVFALARPVMTRFGSAEDFQRRRNVWLLLTVTAFLSSNFWLFTLVAVPVLIWAGRRDKNPVALYLLLLFVVPEVAVEIPALAVQRLFALDIYRLLSLCVLVPAAWQLWQSRRGDPTSWSGMDALLLSYGALQIALFIPYDSPTDVLRRTFLFLLDVYVLYYVVSRACATRRAITEAMAYFCLAGALMACVGIFETLRNWLVYTDLATQWQSNFAAFYFKRGGALRAEASASAPLVLGFLLAISLGFWLYLQSHIKAVAWRLAAALMWCLGLIATYSRGPWIGAVVILLTFSLLDPRGMSRLFKALAVGALLAGVILLTPLGQHALLGGSDPSTLVYREALAHRAWALFQQHPFFGDPFVTDQMEELRQGQGIIDLVNTYIEVGLFQGLAGLTLFLAFILVALSRVYRTVKRVAISDRDLALLGASLAACIVGTLVMISACSFILGYEKMFYVLAGLAICYSRLAPAAAQRQTMGSELPRAATYVPLGYRHGHGRRQA